ncbi:MAG: alkaline phosphatase family protein [Pirellulaceae bacterium]|nr:alkaline phosphatase family protein [Pirellulaceae bacterium]
MNANAFRMYPKLLIIIGIIAAGIVLPSSQHAIADVPRIVVVISVDQLCYEFLERFESNISETGMFSRVAREGTSFTNCHHRHAFTFTGPGHASIATGAYAPLHGIVGNSWYDRGTEILVNCVFDSTAVVLGATALEGTSPKNLLVPTLGDSLKLATARKAKVLSVSIKDRAAILMGGHLADGAFWFDINTGNWVTSSHYLAELPGYLRQLNESGFAQSSAGKTWNLLRDVSTYRLHRPDNYHHEKPPLEFTREFPHTMSTTNQVAYFEQFITSRFANDYTLLTAREIIEFEELGQDDIPDLLWVGLSANDYVGHRFGPYSLEVEDIFYRTDERLGDLARYLDRQVGVGQWTIALTADHGVAPIPAYADNLGLASSPDPLGNLEQLQETLEASLASFLGAEEYDTKLVTRVEPTQIYLANGHPEMKGARFTFAQRHIRDFLLGIPVVTAAITREALLSGGGGGNLLGEFQKAFHPGRSGDILFVLAPYHSYPNDYAATHGSPWKYDTHVPLMFLGSGVKQGKHNFPTSPATLTPTLAKLLHVPSPAGCEIEPLLKAIE